MGEGLSKRVVLDELSCIIFGVSEGESFWWCIQSGAGRRMWRGAGRREGRGEGVADVPACRVQDPIHVKAHVVKLAARPILHLDYALWELTLEPFPKPRDPPASQPRLNS